MSKKFIRFTAACVLTAVVLYAGGIQPHSAAAVAISTSVYEPLQEQAQRWVDELAVQPAFAKWKQSTLDISPIGPGTHSWLVLVKHSSTTVGYLIVHAVEAGGYQLGEYGSGTRPLFDNHTLSRSLKQLELTEPAAGIEALYVHPLLAAWKVNADHHEFYTDAASGEALPAEANDWLAASTIKIPKAEQLYTAGKSSLLKQVVLPSFNPYDKLPWLTEQPLPLRSDSYSSLFTKINSKEQLRYAAELFDGQMLYVWSVVGYNKWSSGHIYVALEAEEDSTIRRYIPVLLLLELGSFYR
ncbi:hypothetical protein BK133_07430 [Paenibacillus sp. FSL H8-0548]|uniref:hypothetical protein n=1 Tax=Paenibacillus sp. FSL H8-0548 TaxID=1920422 RepID=UPI00096DCECE|nr:hypothetical protein [Paenibacillus sp. FSL H8-0548]OMF37034.1 hypothetical protein BK133_07430 [Paenibacillus sp. FSL H8-0548]